VTIAWSLNTSEYTFTLEGCVLTTTCNCCCPWCPSDQVGELHEVPDSSCSGPFC
jgi:hypothetical protein